MAMDVVDSFYTRNETKCLPGFELGNVVQVIVQDAPQRHSWTLSRVLREVPIQGRGRLFDLGYKMLDYDSNGYNVVTIKRFSP